MSIAIRRSICGRGSWRRIGINRDGSAEAEPYNRAEPDNRVAPSTATVWGRASARPGSRQVTFSLPQLALAASLLIAVSAGVTYLAA